MSARTGVFGAGPVRFEPDDGFTVVGFGSRSPIEVLGLEANLPTAGSVLGLEANLPIPGSGSQGLGEGSSASRGPGARSSPSPERGARSRADLRSWLAARLARLTDGDPRIFTGAVEEEPDGLFVADLLAVDQEGKVLAKLQLQAAPDALALLGVAGRSEAGARAADALVRTLAADPAGLADVEVTISGPRGEEVVGRRSGRLL